VKSFGYGTDREKSNAGHVRTVPIFGFSLGNESFPWRALVVKSRPRDLFASSEDADAPAAE
jgi:hypothetical protein